MSIEAFRRAYAPERIGREWGFRSSDYASGRHRGLDVRLVHSSGDYSIETDVIAISDGVVDYVGRPNNSLGPTLRIRRDGGGYEFHSHTIADVSVGTRTTAGTRLGRNARMSERPGLIFGVHDHVVFSDYADGAWNTDRPTRDPYPIIVNRLAAVAASDARPLPPSPQEDTMTVSINLNGKHLLAVGQEFVSHHGTGSQAEITRRVMSVTDEEHRLNTAQFQDLLDGLGIPRWVVNVDNGQVFNPETGKFEHNGVWSRHREMLAKFAALTNTLAAKPGA